MQLDADFVIPRHVWMGEINNMMFNSVKWFLKITCGGMKTLEEKKQKNKQLGSPSHTSIKDLLQFMLSTRANRLDGQAFLAEVIWLAILLLINEYINESMNE